MAPKANIPTPALYAQQFRRGDEPGLRYFFDAYYAPLCHYGQNLCGDEGFAAEMASEAFYQTWRQRAQLASEGAIRAYLYTLVKNGCFQYLRKKSRQSLPNTALQPQPEPTAQEAIIYIETIRELHLAITRLPKQCRIVLHLLFIEGKTVSEISEQLKLSISTVKTHKRIGLQAIKKQWRFEG